MIYNDFAHIYSDTFQKIGDEYISFMEDIDIAAIEQQYDFIFAHINILAQLQNISPTHSLMIEKLLLSHIALIYETMSNMCKTCKTLSYHKSTFARYATKIPDYQTRL